MKLINSSIKQWHCGYTLPEIWSHIARCTRVCYQSEPRDNGESNEEFVKRVILRNHSFEEIAESRELQLKLHLSCLEHGTVYLDIPNSIQTLEFLKIFKNNRYSKICQHGNLKKNNIAITTNMRVIVENNLIPCITYYLCAPTKYHSLRTTFNIITDIGIARELARHRTHSISEESTRYCNYSKDKFDNQLTFIIPEWANMCTPGCCNVIIDDVYDNSVYNPIIEDSQPLYNDEITKDFLLGLCKAEDTYFSLISNGYTPQQARQVLPLSTKVQTIHTAFNSDWDEFVKLRADGCSGSVHPNMKVIANKIKSLMSKENATDQ